MHFLGTLIALSIVGHHCCRSSWWLHGKTHTIERYEMHGFYYTPWERSWHGISHTAWFLPWGMGFVMLHDLFHVLPYMTLGKRCPRSLPGIMINMKTLSFWCPVIIKKFGGCPQKNGFWAQKQHFWAQKGSFWAIGPKKRPAERPNGHLPENQRYPELPHDMGDLWSHWVGSVWPQKMGVI